MSEPFLGTIMPVAFGYAPESWMTCQGQSMSIQQYQALYALLGITFGGNGSTTFNLPNLSGRVMVGQGQSPVSGTNYTWGQNGGAETQAVTLTTANLPPHNHTATFTGTASTVTINASNTGSSTQSNPGAGLALAQASTNAIDGASEPAQVKIYGPANVNPVALTGGTVTPTGTVAVANTGTGSPVSVNRMQPWLSLYMCIAIQGLWPSRP